MTASGTNARERLSEKQAWHLVHLDRVLRHAVPFRVASQQQPQKIVARLRLCSRLASLILSETEHQVQDENHMTPDKYL